MCANTPAAKGRVERAHLTLQDRLVKELRLQRISTVDAANEFMPTFIEDYNRRFGKLPRIASHNFVTECLTNDVTGGSQSRCA